MPCRSQQQPDPGKSANLDAGQWEALRALHHVGVGSAAQPGTTDGIVEGLERIGLAEPRRWHDPAIRLWEPTRRGDTLASDTLNWMVPRHA